MKSSMSGWAQCIPTAAITAKTPAEKLFAANLPLVIRTCARMGFYEDDDFQIASMAMWNAARDYDRTRGFEFSTLAVNYIKNRMRTEWRYRNCTIRKPELPVVTINPTRDSTFDYGFEFNLNDPPDPSDHQAEYDDRAEARTAAIRILRRLVKSPHWQIIKARFRGESLPSIAARLGVTRQAIQHRINKALQACREALK
jgi:RNA polymerase sigma factor (sigma-70 family)